MDSKRVLILGGSSYVAQFLCLHFLNDRSIDDGVHVACTLRNAEGAPLPEGFTAASTAAPRTIQVYTGVSLFDMPSVRSAIQAFQPNVVINCIAMSSPAACEKDPAAAMALNQPTALIDYLHESAQLHPLRYIHFSTDFVYDGNQPPARGYREEDATPASSQCVYSTTKLAFDRLLIAASSPKLQVLVLRIANVVGGPAPLFPQQAPKFVEWLVTELFHSPEKSQTPVRLWSDEIRSFLYVQDLARLVWLLIESNTAGSHVLNVGGREALSRVEFAELLLRQASPRVLGSKSPRLIDPARRADVSMGYHAPLDARLDCSRLQSLLPSYKPTPTEQVVQAVWSALDKNA